MTTPISRELDHDWLRHHYFPTLAQEKSTAMDQLHSATNWGLTLITTALVFIISREGFPTKGSLYMSLLILVIGVHFYTRAIKGYVNVIRFAVLQMEIIQIECSEQCAAGALGALFDHTDSYHGKWHLPMKRWEAYRKVLIELGFVYILGAVILTVCFAIYSERLWISHWPLIVAALVVVALELVLFNRTAYMKNVKPITRAKVIG